MCFHCKLTSSTHSSRDKQLHSRHFPAAVHLRTFDSPQREIPLLAKLSLVSGRFSRRISSRNSHGSYTGDQTASSSWARHDFAIDSTAYDSRRCTRALSRRFWAAQRLDGVCALPEMESMVLIPANGIVRFSEIVEIVLSEFMNLHLFVCVEKSRESQVRV